MPSFASRPSHFTLQPYCCFSRKICWRRTSHSSLYGRSTCRRRARYLTERLPCCRHGQYDDQATTTLGNEPRVSKLVSTRIQNIRCDRALLSFSPRCCNWKLPTGVE